ncbi:transformer-2 protein homolog beta-like [Anopheles ziemanni]|uniref:transformer-2 protein homolog beta-like n=1 Tax=Anopheles coustani TaxID=139045 RepID=UPI0026593765|nr:transformer-2 protein homolog beta-like [Anopheles coustani]XP_058177987.1 transformer-2 protein homolog beta-like [Anopheles ziemanni]
MPGCLGIFGMSPNTMKKDLMGLFSYYGPINYIKLIYDAKTNVSRGYSFIYFKYANDAWQAQRSLNGTVLDGRKVRIDFCTAKPDKGRTDRRKRSPSAAASTSVDHGRPR